MNYIKVREFVKIILGEIRARFYQHMFKYAPKIGRLGRIGMLHGTKYISIGYNTRFGNDIYLTAWKKCSEDPKLIVGANCEFGAMNHITCCNSVIIGDNVLTGKWVTITDNSHGKATFEDMHKPPMVRDVVSKGPVKIGNNVWIGDKATILPSVTISNGVIIGANSVVTKDVPDFSLACGNPAIIIRKFFK